MHQVFHTSNARQFNNNNNDTHHIESYQKLISDCFFLLCISLSNYWLVFSLWLIVTPVDASLATMIRDCGFQFAHILRAMCNICVYDDIRSFEMDTVYQAIHSLFVDSFHFNILLLLLLRLYRHRFPLVFPSIICCSTKHTIYTTHMAYMRSFITVLPQPYKMLSKY